MNMLSDFFTYLWHQLGASNEQIKSITAIVAAGLAFYGLRTWRLQLKGTAEYTLAKDVLKAVYRVREAFKHVRNPAIYSYEYPEAMRSPSGHLKSEFNVEGTAHVYEERFKMLNDAFRTLEDRTLDSQVEWGADYADVIVPLRKCRAELLVTLQSHVDSLKPSYQQLRESAEQIKRANSVMYYLGEKRHDLDSFTPEINAAVSQFEQLLRPIIGTRFGL